MIFFTEYIAYLKKRKKFWLLPAAISLLIIGLIIIASTGSVFAPFIYTIF